ncbi:MAG: hypothetical protein KAV82_10430 [Phycisphaerae bacterium]|nr:hypothetical protein [Phycisphaerae bacterium]
MNNTRRKKCDTGRSQKSRYRDKTGKILLECGVNDYLGNREQQEDSNTTVMTVLADRTHTPEDSEKMAQMNLWDQSVKVSPDSGSSDSAAPAAPRPVEKSAEQAEPRTPTPRAIPMSRCPQPKSKDRFTPAGFLKGCGLGVVVAAVLLFIYLLIR